jgi:beta-phosphoglucomutase-like phosphatase (HAD superfamily)
VDGTLVDSIGAVENAWGGVATELSMDPEEVIAATHGRRAIDNLRDLKPELANTPDSQMDPHVKEFEERILNEADAYNKEVHSRRESVASSRVRRYLGGNLDLPSSVQIASRRASRSASRRASQVATPDGSNTPASHSSSHAASRSSSFAAAGRPSTGSFAQELSKR